MQDWQPLAPLPGWQRRIAAGTGTPACEVQVWRPPQVPATQPLPAVYVLDGADLFPTVAEAVRRLARRSTATQVTPAMVVGVESTGPDRHRDFTPGPAAEEATAARACGGASTFMRFLCEDLVPAVERSFPVVTGARNLFGHSLAGYFVLQTLAARPAAFASYVAISPSIWWDEAHLHAALDAASFSGQRLFLAHGQWEQQLAPWQEKQPDAATTAARRQRRRLPARCRELATRLRSRPGMGDIVQQEFPDEDHGSVVMVATARALRFLLAPAEAVPS